MEIEALTAGKGNHTHPLSIKEKLDYFVSATLPSFAQTGLPFPHIFLFYDGSDQINNATIFPYPPHLRCL